MRWNITDVPEELARLVKAEAARLGVPLRQYVVDTMSLAVQRQGYPVVAAKGENKTARKRVRRDAVSKVKVDMESAPSEVSPRRYTGPEHDVTCNCGVCKIKRGEL